MRDLGERRELTAEFMATVLDPRPDKHPSLAMNLLENVVVEYLDLGFFRTDRPITAK
jgi:hypothetical protein